MRFLTSVLAGSVLTGNPIALRNAASGCYVISRVGLNGEQSGDCVVSRLPGQSRPSERIRFDIHVDESRCFQPMSQIHRIDGIVSVSFMMGLELWTGQTIPCDKHAHRTQYSGDFREEAVLELGGWHMMQHREARSATEATVMKIQCRRVSSHNRHRSVSCEPVHQHRGEIMVDLHGCQPRYGLRENIGRGSITRTNFENVVAEVHIL